jgi:hypothetical protein
MEYFNIWVLNLDKEMFIIPVFLVQQIILYKMILGGKSFNENHKHPIR